jgi:LmbE family N-acetylglucosaminyl deacetylase
MNKLKPKRMLVILAHPDDESFAVGGTLAKYAHQGVLVVLLCATRGEAGIPGAEPEEAGGIREQELRNAAKHLGIEVYFLGYMDGELSKVNPAALLENISCWIDLVEPQVILTFGPDGISGHSDHVTVSHIVTQAVDKFFPGLLLLYIAPSEATCLGCGVSSSKSGGDKSLIPVDISDYAIEKVRAIQCHISQHPPLEGKPEEVVDQIPCHEYFTVAHLGSNSNSTVDWFEEIKDRTEQLM